MNERSGDALDNAMARARARGAQRTAEILSSPDMLTENEFGSLLGVTQETLEQLRQSSAVLALEGSRHGRRYPKWQLTDDGQPLPRLKEVTAELGDHWWVYRFLLQAHPELGGKTALECLKAGRIDEAVETARGIARGSFS